jgi:hypothetical protein
MDPIDLDALLDTNIAESEIVSAVTPAEMRIFEKLSTNFHFDERLRSTTIRALYRFKQVYRHYAELWRKTADELTSDQQANAHRIFAQIEHNLDRNARSCFANGNFFGNIRFLLYACNFLEVPDKQKWRYLEWVLSFPVIPERSVKAIFEHELFPNNLPHVFIYRTAGFLRDAVVSKKKYRQICAGYRIFLREHKVTQAHSAWFKKRFAGSAGSRQ